MSSPAAAAERISDDATNNTIPASDEPRDKEADTPPAAKKSWKFWSVFFSLCLLSLSTSIESTIVTTALPKIVDDIDMGSKYVWVGNAFLLASAVVQPFIGQLANVFGRRWPLLIVTACFTLGSGIAGGATNAGMMIGGRTVQGLGSGGIYVLIDIVVSDLVPLQERAQYVGLVLVTGAVGATIGPVLGGAIADANWRWVFYLMLVTGGLSLIYLFFFAHFKHEEKRWKQALAEVDYFGAVVFIGSVTSLLLGLVMGGVVFPWNSANVIVPIVIGAVGWAAFHVYEATSFCKNPMVPPHLFMNRTAAAGFVLAFDAALLLYYVVWFLPIYFQGVRGDTPLQSGVHQLPFNIVLIPAAMIGGGMVTKLGKYLPFQYIAFGMMAIGAGLFTLLKASSSTVAWAWFEIIASIGMGMATTTILPAIQASLTDADVASMTSMYAFLRSFGGIWGVTIPSVIFNSQVNNFLDRISDPNVRNQLADGNAYGYASTGATASLPEDVRNEVLGVYTDALKTVWQIAVAFSLAGFVVVFAVKQLDMSRQNDTKFGLEEDRPKKVTEMEKGEKSEGSATIIPSSEVEES
ncbi:MFS general substrate transporter [Annulohypoxylon maeteangense]|uniref:MFS general substrate transporter n=1 Tax=Annulohypoxylon maeteangense TaxID=1927788 RepID=UPI0020089DD2|nr:MFS general substrate transporter [Annulohypoxylon maeteangense]KAI0886478.1 MFS general substrate transporter [Annulohypoxylon maeteangense]